MAQWFELLDTVSPGPTPSPSAIASPAPSGSPNPSDLGGALIPHLTSEQATALIMVLLLLTFFAVATPLFLRILASDLFRIPYITWYMLHWGVAVTAMLVLAILALAGLLSSPLIALFASVFGYVLGSQGTRGTSPDTGTPKALAVHKILPPSASPGSMVTITGQGFDQGVTVLFGNQPMAQIVVAGDGSMLSGMLPATAAKGKVDVVVKNPSGAAQTMTQAFEVV